MPTALSKLSTQLTGSNTGLNDLLVDPCKIGTDGFPIDAVACKADAERRFAEEEKKRGWMGTAGKAIITAASFVPVIGQGVAAVSAALSAQQNQELKAERASMAAQPLISSFTGLPTNPGVNTMGIFDSGFNIFNQDAGGNLSVNWGDVLNLGTGLAINALAPSRAPVAASPVQAVPAMAVAGPAMRSVAVVGRSLFNRFPNLATGIQRLRNAGQKVTRAKLYSVMKRFGPEFLVSGGLLTAAAVSELAVAGPGRRRMNPANSKALKRSMRRLQSFHRLAQKADVLASCRKRRRC